MRINKTWIVALIWVAVSPFAFATSASAVTFFFDNVRGDSCNPTSPYPTLRYCPGDNVTAELWVDTEKVRRPIDPSVFADGFDWKENGDNYLQAWFLQVNHGGGATATAVSVEPFIIVDGVVATPLGPPVINGAAGGDATGQFAFTVSPPNAFAPGSRFKYGSISLTVGFDLITINVSEAGGAVGGPGGVDLVAAGRVVFGSIPEPTTALLVGLGLIGLGVRRRVR